MTRRDPAAACPPDVLGWIPWYPDHGLTDAQRGAVEAHAAVCPSCRDEIAMLATDAAGEEEAGDSALVESEAVWARVLTRIAVEDEERDGFESGTTPPMDRGQPAGPGRWRQWERRSLAWAAGLVGALVGLGIGAGALSSLSDADPVYEVASESMRPVAGSQLDVVFQPEASAAAINEALRALGAQLVAGPSELGVFRVRLPGNADAMAVAQLLRAEPNAVALFAEPVAVGQRDGDAEAR